MRVALAQLNSTVGDIRGNSALVVERANLARECGARLVVFPELVVSGYPPEDLLLKDHFLAGCREALDEIAAGCAGIVALVGLPLEGEGATYNAAAVVADQSVVGWYRKIWLPNYGVFDEKRYFSPGERLTVVEIEGTRVAVTICEDIWKEGGPGEEAAHAGAAAVVANLSMSPYHRGKGNERYSLLAERATAACAYVCYVNGVGGQDELVFDGQSMVLDPSGRLIARGAQFKEELLLVDLDPKVAGEAQGGIGASRGGQRWPVDVVDAAARTAGSKGERERKGAGKPPSATARVCDPLGPEEEVYAALCLGVEDYTKKNGFRRVVMGVSGGIDSALTACIAVDALGSRSVNTVSMPSRYSSEGTMSDAKELAERLRTHYYEIPIEGVFTAYLESLAPYLAEETPGVTEENIQARVRGNLLMALSNRFGWLVLTTGNKSEMAVGYATLYGDMAGGFAVLKDVPKTLVYRLAGYRNSLGPGTGPIPVSTITRAPSAELSVDQTDQDTLPAYEILDQIIDAYVVRDESVEEIVSLGMDEKLVRRVVAMIDGNEYKRRQGAPGVRITPKAFGKDRRLPITNRFRG